MRSDNEQILEAWRPSAGTNDVKWGDYKTPQQAFGGILIKNASRVYVFKGRIVRSRRGRRTNEVIVGDQEAVSTLEWVLFFPRKLKLLHFDKILDADSNVYQIISFSSKQNFKHMFSAILREVQ